MLPVVPLGRLLDVAVCLSHVLVDAPLCRVLVKAHLRRVLVGVPLGHVLIAGR